MIKPPTRQNVIHTLTLAMFELAEDLHDRSTEPHALIDSSSAKIIAAKSSALALIAETAAALVTLEATDD